MWKSHGQAKTHSQRPVDAASHCQFPRFSQRAEKRTSRDELKEHARMIYSSRQVLHDAVHSAVLAWYIRALTLSGAPATNYLADSA